MASIVDHYAGSARRQWWLVVILTIAATVAVVDRAIISLLADPIKRDLQLSDTQLGLIFGFAFAVANVLFTLPAGYLADRISRRGLIAAGCVVWSVMTGVCGMAGNFFQLLLSRAGVGFAESVIHPSSFSMLRASQSPERRGRAFAVYGMALLVGSGIGFVVGAWLLKWLATGGLREIPMVGELRPWRQVLLVLGIVGLPASLLMLCIREPLRAAADVGNNATISAALAHIRRYWAVYIPIFLFSAFSSMKANAYATFVASIPQRRWGMPAAEVGHNLGLQLLIAAPLGLWCIGYVTDLLTRRFGARGIAMVAIGTMLLGLIFSVSAPLAASPATFFALATGDFFVGGGAFPIAGAVIALITPLPNMGKTSSIQLFVYGLLGMGIGPALVGYVSDHWFPGPAGIAPALSCCSAVFMSASLLAACLLYRSLRTAKWE